MEQKLINGKIYMIKSLVNEDIYIGSTCMTLSLRMNRHRNDKKKNCESHKIINDRHECILIEDYPCYSKTDLLKREQYWIDKFCCINKNRSYITKEETKKYREEYRLSNKDRLNKYRREWREFKKSWGYNNYLGTNLSLLDIDPNLFN